MAASIGAIRAARAFVELFVEDAKLRSGLLNAEARVRAFGVKMKAIGQQMLTMGIASAAPIAMATHTFIGFDDQMRAVKASIGATGKEFDQLTEKAKLLGRTTSFTASQVAGSMLVLGRAGFAPQEIDNAIDGILNLSRATGTDLAVSADIAGNSLRAFQLDASQMNRVSDVLTATANNGALTLTDLGESLKEVAPIAREAGMSLEETSKVIGALSNFGIKGSQAGTSLRRILTNMADPKIQPIYESMGVNVKDKNGGLREVSAVLRDVAAAVNDMPNAERLAIFKEIFGLYGMASGASLTVASFDQLNDAIDHAAGTASAQAKEMDAGLGGTLRMLLSAAEGTGIAIGEALAGELMNFGNAVTSTVGKITEWINANRSTVALVAKIIAGIVVLGGTFYTVGMLSNVFAMGIGAVGRVMGMIAPLATAVSGNLTRMSQILTTTSRGYDSIGAASTAMLNFLRLPIAERSTQIASGLLLMSQAQTAAFSRNAIAEAWKAAPFVMDLYITKIKAATLSTIRMASVNNILALSAKGLATVKMVTCNIIGMFSMANIKAAANAIKTAAANTLLSASTKGLCAAFLASQVVMKNLISLPVLGWLTAIAAIATVVVASFKNMEQYVAKVSDAMKGLHDKGNQTRKVDLIKFERLDQLSQKNALSTEEMTEASQLMADLESRYGSLGHSLDETAKRFTLAANAQDDFMEGMRRQAIQEKDARIKELNKNIEEKQKEAEGKKKALGYGIAPAYNTAKKHGAFGIAGFVLPDAPESIGDATAEKEIKELEKQTHAMLEERAQMQREMRLIQDEKNNAVLVGDDESQPLQNKIADEKNKRSVSLADAASAEQKYTEMSKKFTKERQTQLQNEIDDINEETKAWKELLSTLIQAEKEKKNPDDEKIRGWEHERDTADSNGKERIDRVKKKHVEEFELSNDDIIVSKMELAVTDAQIQYDDAKKTGDQKQIQKSDIAMKEAKSQLVGAELQKAINDIKFAKSDFYNATSSYENAKKSGNEEGIRKAAEWVKESQERLGSATSYYDRIREGVDTAKEKADRYSTLGTFSAAAVRGLGASSTLDRVANATEKTEKNTKKMADKTTTSGKFA